MRPGATVPATLNLANSMVGVALLSFPYALKQTGLILGLITIFITAYLSLLSSKFLCRSSSATRRRSFQYLVLFTHGPIGKILVELSIIGLNIGACVAFFVVIGDVISEFLARNVDPNAMDSVVESFHSDKLDISFYKNMILVSLAVFVVLPLALVKDIESFAKCSAFSLAFYCIFAFYVLYVFCTRVPPEGKEALVELSKPEGLLEIMPIFAGAFTCQPALFPLMEFLQDDTPKSMEKVTKYAVAFVSVLYSFVGVFGYLTFGDRVMGDMLHNLDQSPVTDFFKICFAFSIVLSFPLAIYPLRSSLETLLFQVTPPDFSSKSSSNEFSGGVHIPQSRFAKMTMMIICSSLTTGILIPHFEKILAFTGSTAGLFISMILPAIVYLYTLPKGETNKAKMLLVAGVVLSVVGTINVMSTAPSDPISQILADKQLRRPSILYNDPAIQEDYLKQRKMIEESIRLEEIRIKEEEVELEKRREDLLKQKEDFLEKPAGGPPQGLAALNKTVGNLTKTNEVGKHNSSLIDSAKILVDERKAADLKEGDEANEIDKQPHIKTKEEDDILQKIKETQDLQEKLMAHQNELIGKLEVEHVPGGDLASGVVSNGNGDTENEVLADAVAAEVVNPVPNVNGDAVNAHPQPVPPQRVESVNVQPQPVPPQRAEAVNDQPIPVPLQGAEAVNFQPRPVPPQKAEVKVQPLEDGSYNPRLPKKFSSVSKKQQPISEQQKMHQQPGLDLNPVKQQNPIRDSSLLLNKPANVGKKRATKHNPPSDIDNNGDTLALNNPVDQRKNEQISNDIKNVVDFKPAGIPPLLSNKESQVHQEANPEDKKPLVQSDPGSNQEVLPRSDHHSLLNRDIESQMFMGNKDSIVLK